MGMLQNLAAKLTGRSEESQSFKRKFKEAQENQKIERIINERSKSSEERELLRYQNEMREDDIKKQLKTIHDKQNRDNWNSPSKILTKGSPILKHDEEHNILKQKKIFTNNKSLFLKRSKL